MTRLHYGRITQDVGILEVDSLVLEGISGVEQDFSLAVELDGLGGFVDSVGLDDCGLAVYLFGDDPSVLLIHVLDMANAAPHKPSHAHSTQTLQ